MVKWQRESDKAKFTTILGVDFFHGTANEAVNYISSRGGLLVVPAAPALKDIQSNPGYREALLGADLAITDSAFMVLVWNLVGRGRKIHRVSGLEYLVQLLDRREASRPGNMMWIMPGRESADRNLAYLRERGIHIPDEHVVLAPMYGKEIEDKPLLELIERTKPKHIVIAVGGGTQERLGLYLKQNLSYLPSIHCIGAAIAFLSGDQVHIPMWADKFYMGWLFRSLDNPKRFVPRYWAARKLFGLMLRYRDRLPEPQ
ncbi:WecB/TagA/CpsF family glycosyltransferase [Granulicella cerasi]|uniref:WecB/TagA/CpsF family glycosyltransferase n=1 Tax=Granulicella cerasi TaxID=741063 RepID=A0ABW1ZEH5_9BACT|nr:WecB/TagA/CpsF family glycosyltransferase [Granulicella cerasi]